MKNTLKDLILLIKVNPGGNLTAVFLSLLAGMIFWFFNALNKNYSTNIRYPVEFVYNTDQYVAVSILPEDILMNVDGVGWNLLRKSIGLKVEPLSILIEEPRETKKIPGSSIPALITDQLSELQLNYILTDTLFLDIDYIIEKKLPLIIDSAEINLENNYAITSRINISIDSVLVSGPENIINSMGQSITLSIADTEIDEDYEEEMEINTPASNLIKRTPPTVNVSFQVRELESHVLNVTYDRIHFDDETNNYVLLDSTLKINYTYPEETPLPNTNDFGFSVRPLNDSIARFTITVTPPLVFLSDTDSLNLRIKKVETQ